MAEFEGWPVAGNIDDFDADWLREERLSYYEEGMTQAEWLGALHEAGWSVEEFRTTASFQAALQRKQPEWIMAL